MEGGGSFVSELGPRDLSSACSGVLPLCSFCRAALALSSLAARSSLTFQRLHRGHGNLPALAAVLATFPAPAAGSAQTCQCPQRSAVLMSQLVGSRSGSHAHPFSLWLEDQVALKGVCGPHTLLELQEDILYGPDFMTHLVLNVACRIDQLRGSATQQILRRHPIRPGWELPVIA